MSQPTAATAIPVDLRNPGQFFACCGLLELAGRMDDLAEAWFTSGQFHLRASVSLADLLGSLRTSSVDDTMTSTQKARLDELSRIKNSTDGEEEEKKALESLRREAPIVLTGHPSIVIDWFTDESAGGSRLKTWAGQQSVLAIASTMHTGLPRNAINDGSVLWTSVRGLGVPFYFDSDLGAQGSPLDIGFSFNPLRAAASTRIEETNRPALELLAFIGLQRFRPREIPRANRFVYVAWPTPLPASIAASVACQAVSFRRTLGFEFRLLHRNKYYKSFLPAIPYQGDRDE